MCLELILTYVSFLIDKVKSLSQGDVHTGNRFSQRRVVKSIEDASRLSGVGKLFQSLGKGKNSNSNFKKIHFWV